MIIIGCSGFIVLMCFIFNDQIQMNKPLQSRNRTLRGPLFHFQLSQLKFITKLIRVNFN